MAATTEAQDTAAAAAQQVFQFATGYIISSALNTIVKLGVPDRLAAGPQTAAALAGEVGANEDALYRILRVLSMVGLFSEDAQRRFSLTPASELLRSDVPGSMKAMVSWIASPFHYRVHADMIHSARTGETAIEHTYGKPAFEYLAGNPELSELFNNAMTGFSVAAVRAVLEAYDFSGIEVLVDVAGGHGAVLTTILQRYPSMRGILFDLDHVIAGARPRIAALGLAGRCEAIEGDFFVQVPSGGDAYVMQHIIHDWDDDRALMILRQIRTALAGKPRGRLLLLEGILAPANQPDPTKLIDIEMLMMTGGRERTEAEFRALLQEAGFELTRVVHTRGPICVIEAEPR
jgi:O-methyltransferase domain/Dimerisation domain